MKTPAFARIKRYFFSARQWYLQTSERALEQAYDAAVQIKKIEDEHFSGNKISLDAEYGDTVSSYFQVELKKHLRIARLRLMEFKTSNSLINLPRVDNNESIKKVSAEENTTYSEEYTLDASQYTAKVEVNSKATQLLEKLRFIDSVIAKYKIAKPETKPSTLTFSDFPNEKSEVERNNSGARTLYADQNSSVGKSGFVPRSIIRTANKLKRDLDPNLEKEEEALKNFRRSRFRTKVTVKFFLLLIIVPLLTQQVSKNFIFGPLVNYFNNTDQIEIPLNSEVEEKVLVELERFKEKIEFQRLIGQLPDSTQDIEEKIRDKANELAKEYRWLATEPVKNVLADILSLGAFSLVIATGKREIAVIKSFIDETVYGLSDSAKAFVIILLTDMFVGFHSPHGWVVVVEGTLRHFGLPENQSFIDIFIATFPVMLDTVFKYWIFRYLNQISPSAVATYRNMNE